jgi:hypothetical protein
MSEGDGSVWLSGSPNVIDVLEEKPIVNFRAWKPHCLHCWSGMGQHEKHIPLLLSLYAFGVWHPGVKVAENGMNQTWTWTCGNQVERVPSPMWHGTHGLYAMKRLGELFQRIRDHEPRSQNTVGVFPLIFGKCEQWGQVVRYDDGARSQYARIQRLYVPPHLKELKDGLAEHYQVPVSIRRYP